MIRRLICSRCLRSYSKISEEIGLEVLNLDVADENDNPAQIDSENTNNQISGNVKKSVLCGLMLRFLYSVNLIR